MLAKTQLRMDPKLRLGTEIKKLTEEPHETQTPGENRTLHPGPKLQLGHEIKKLTEETHETQTQDVPLSKFATQCSLKF